MKGQKEWKDCLYPSAMSVRQSLLNVLMVNKKNISCGIYHGKTHKKAHMLIRNTQETQQSPGDKF